MNPLLASLIADQKRCNKGDDLCRHNCKRCARMSTWRDAKRPL